MPSLILRLEPLPDDLEGSTLPRPGSPDAANAAPVVDIAEHERLAAATPLSRWSAAVAAAQDACLVVDQTGSIVSISAAAAELLGCSDAAVIGRGLLDVVQVVDLETGAPRPEYATRITPLAVLHGPGLMRSLMRVRHYDDTLLTLDTMSAPIHDAAGHPIGSISYLATLARL